MLPLHFASDANFNFSPHACRCQYVPYFDVRLFCLASFPDSRGPLLEWSVVSETSLGWALCLKMLVRQTPHGGHDVYIAGSMKAYNHNAEPRAGHVAQSLKYYCANIRTQVQISRTQKKNIKPEVVAQAQPWEDRDERILEASWSSSLVEPGNLGFGVSKNNVDWRLDRWLSS